MNLGQFLHVPIVPNHNLAHTRPMINGIILYLKVKVKEGVVQSYPTLHGPMDCSLPGSPVLGILQVKILEWLAISFSRGLSQSRDQTQVSCIAGRFLTV